MPRNPTTKEIAYHEAGHAYVAWELGLPFKHVTIEPDKGALGHVLSKIDKRFRPDISLSLRKRDRLEREVLMCLAGIAAERKLTGRHNWIGATSDIHDAIDLASYLHDDPEILSAYFKYMKLRAESLVADPAGWRCIERLAAVLLKRKTTTETEAIEVFHATMRDVP